MADTNCNNTDLSRALADEANMQQFHIIIAGYGPVGRVVAQSLEAAGVRIVVIDTNPNTVQRQLELGRQAVCGDATDPQVLRNAGIDRASVLVLAIPDGTTAVKACKVARELAPDIFIAARTNFLSKGLLATEAGANHVTVEEVVTAQAMREGVLRHLTSSHKNAAANVQRANQP